MRGGSGPRQYDANKSDEPGGSYDPYHFSDVFYHSSAADDLHDRHDRYDLGESHDLDEPHDVDEPGDSHEFGGSGLTT